MVATHTSLNIDSLAQTLFEVLSRFGLTVPRLRRRGDDLKEVEYLTLSLLHQQPTMIVGDIQRHLGVLPAQMSRILRALETRDRPLISCRINPQDKRKVDVTLTAAGIKGVREYQSSRILQITSLLTNLTPEELESLNHLLDRFQEILSSLRNGSD